jgi:23S rRNA pseudouridine1911/1915/1917 synthase
VSPEAGGAGPEDDRPDAELTPSEAEAEAEDAPALAIVHLDDDLAVIDKPAGLVVHPAPSHTGPTVVSELGDLLGGGDPERPGIVHRLDKETSGLMVVARNPETLAALQEAVRERHVERRYLALAGGRLGSRTGTIDAPIGRASKRRTRMAVSGAASREARTHFEVLELLSRESYLEARLETGRTHQIRAHFAAIGHPLVGDATYGGRPRYGLRRQFLHAHRLSFAHPRTGAPLDFRSSLPDDLEAALEAARAE